LSTSKENGDTADSSYLYFLLKGRPGYHSAFGVGGGKGGGGGGGKDGGKGGGKDGGKDGGKGGWKGGGKCGGKCGGKGGTGTFLASATLSRPLLTFSGTSSSLSQPLRHLKASIDTLTASTDTLTASKALSRPLQSTSTLLACNREFTITFSRL
jgi:hypothetical protein